MSRFSTIFYSIIVPSIVALSLVKLNERYQVKLPDLNSVIETVRQILTEAVVKSAEPTPETSKAKMEKKEETINKHHNKNKPPREDARKKEQLKPDSTQTTATTKPELKVKKDTEKIKPLKKEVEVKQTKSKDLRSEKSVNNLSSESNRVKEDQAPLAAKTLDKSPTPKKVNKSNVKQVEENMSSFTKETKLVAETLTTFVTEFDKKLKIYLNELKTSNEIRAAVKVVKQLKEALSKEGKCSLTKEEEHVVDNVGLKGETIVNNCIEIQISKENSLKLAIREFMKKVQGIEENLRQNLKHCPQPPSNFCIQTKNNLLKALKDLSSEDNKKMFTLLSNVNLNEAKTNIDVCIKEDSKKIKIPLEQIHLKLKNCGKV